MRNHPWGNSCLLSIFSPRSVIVLIQLFIFFYKWKYWSLFSSPAIHHFDLFHCSLLEDDLVYLQADLEKTSKDLEKLYSKPSWKPRASRFDVLDLITSSDEYWVKRRQREEKENDEASKEIRSWLIEHAKWTTLEIACTKREIDAFATKKQVVI